MLNAETIIALHLFCLLPCLIMVIGARRTSSPLSTLFIWLVVINMVCLLAEAAAWLFEGSSSAFSYYSVRIADVVNQIAAYAKMPVFGEYMYVCLRERTGVSRKVFNVAWISLGLSLILLVISQFNHMYVYFDELNYYHAQPTYFIAELLPLVTALFFGGG